MLNIIFKIYYDLIDLPRILKWFFQRLFRGYDDQDVWNLNWFIVKRIRPAFKAFVKYQAEQGHSLPMEFSTDPAGWLEVLRKIEFAFDSYGDYDKEGDPTACAKGSKEIEEGFELFGRYLSDLWD